MLLELSFNRCPPVCPPPPTHQTNTILLNAIYRIGWTLIPSFSLDFVDTINLIDVHVTIPLGVFDVAHILLPYPPFGIITHIHVFARVHVTFNLASINHSVVDKSRFELHQQRYMYVCLFIPFAIRVSCVDTSNPGKRNRTQRPQTQLSEHVTIPF